MRALSVRQPWAELIMCGRKRYEVRSWTTQFRGRMLIHASQRVEWEASAIAGLQPEELTTGALVGSVELVNCVPLTRDIAAELRRAKAYLDEWNPELYAWQLRAPVRFRHAIPCKGRLGLFHVPEDVVQMEEPAPPPGPVRPHFVQYHNAEKMGYGSDEIREFRILTRKSRQWLENTVLGHMVWLIVGEGRPRRFSLCMAFTADAVRETPTSGFEYSVSGHDGKHFNGLNLGEEPWFDRFKASQGNFAFGLNQIAAEYAPHFERLAAADSNLRGGGPMETEPDSV